MIYQPADTSIAPRYTGPRTFARLPHVAELNGVDAAAFGIPSDMGVSHRTGARFGPEAIRSASALLRPYNPAQQTQVFGALSCIDWGDAPTVPGYVAETLDRAAEALKPLFAAGVLGLGMGGDHSVTLAELRACAATYGQLGLVQLDAHCDLWDDYFGFPFGHGTVFRRAIEEGLIDPGRAVQAGMRGSNYSTEDEGAALALGIDMIPYRELVDITPPQFGDRVRARIGDGPTFFTFDVDFLDPAYCPGTGSPEVGGPTSHQALEYIRALTDIDFRGFDVVEVSPSLDNPGQQTAALAANVLYEMLTLAAMRKQTA